MDKLKTKTIKLITKYPFLTDPIFLFNPANIPEDNKMLSGILDIKYPEIDKYQNILPKIKKDFYKVVNIFNETKFKNNFYKTEFSKRLYSFYKIIRIIEIFYEDEEYEKFNLLNSYYGIDFNLLEKIFNNKSLIKNAFPNVEPILNKSNINKLENTFINSEEIKIYFEEAIKFLNLKDNWNVIVGSAVSIGHTNFNDKGGDIIIPKEYTVSIRRLLELIAHEMDGHCIQFTSCDFLASGGFRYTKSESYVEGFGLYTELSFINMYFGDNTRVDKLFEDNTIKYKAIKFNQTIKFYFSKLKKNKFRFFRGFKNINKFKNLKDFVYIQGLYKIIKLSKKCINIFDVIKSGAINDYYIKEYGLILCDKDKKQSSNLQNTSAVYILEKYFLDLN